MIKKNLLPLFIKFNKNILVVEKNILRKYQKLKKKIFFLNQLYFVISINFTYGRISFTKQKLNSYLVKVKKQKLF